MINREANLAIFLLIMCFFFALSFAVYIIDHNQVEYRVFCNKFNMTYEKGSCKGFDNEYNRTRYYFFNRFHGNLILEDGRQ